jgi:hypothetical protein
VEDKERSDVLCVLTMGEGKDTAKILCWCQRMVVGLITEGGGSAKNSPVANVIWDGLLYVQGW